VNSVGSKSGCKRAPQVVPDNAAWNGFAKSDLCAHAGFFETPPQCVVVHLVGFLIKNELIRCSITTEIGQRVSDLTVHRNKPVLVSLPLNNYQFGGISTLPPRIGKNTGRELKLRCPTFNISNSITFRIPVPNVTVMGAFRKRDRLSAPRRAWFVLRWLGIELDAAQARSALQKSPCGYEVRRPPAAHSPWSIISLLYSNWIDN